MTTCSIQDCEYCELNTQILTMFDFDDDIIASSSGNPLFLIRIEKINNYIY